MVYIHLRKAGTVVAILAVVAVAVAPPTLADGPEKQPHALLAAGDGPDVSHDAAPSDRVTGLIMPMMNPLEGRKLFVSKGCIACHAINGIGGHDAPNLDAHSMTQFMNPFDFAAKMWKGAPAMIAAQEGAFDSQILFTGQELADIIAFVHDHQGQHLFTEADLTPQAMKMMDHDHGAKPATEVHAPELGHEIQPGKPGHTDAPGAPPHKD